METCLWNRQLLKRRRQHGGAGRTFHSVTQSANINPFGQGSNLIWFEFIFYIFDEITNDYTNITQGLLTRLSTIKKIRRKLYRKQMKISTQLLNEEKRTRKVVFCQFVLWPCEHHREQNILKRKVAKNTRAHTRTLIYRKDTSKEQNRIKVVKAIPT